MNWQTRAITARDALAIAAWRYPGELSFYDLEDADGLLDPANGYVAVVDDAGQLAGFLCAGADARVPGGTYDDEALDIGAGLHPALTGHGQSHHLVEIMHRWVSRHHGGKPLRATVAAWNQRARKTVERTGFIQRDAFTRDDGVEFLIYRRDAMPDLSKTEILGTAGWSEPIRLSPPDPSWPLLFTALRQRIATALGPVARRVEHIGSTSIPGIHAKPIVDIQVSVDAVDDEEPYEPRFAAEGWHLRVREPDHRMFRERGTERRPGRPNIHVCQMGGEWERRHLLFRDFLRAHPDRAQAYAQVKLRLIGSGVTSSFAYTNGKDGFIRQAERDAEDWAGGTGWRLPPLS